MFILKADTHFRDTNNLAIIAQILYHQNVARVVVEDLAEELNSHEISV